MCVGGKQGVDIGGLRIRGRIDRVDVAPGGHGLFVYDYKTGAIPAPVGPRDRRGSSAASLSDGVGGRASGGRRSCGGAYLSLSEKKRAGRGHGRRGRGARFRCPRVAACWTRRARRSCSERPGRSPQRRRRACGPVSSHPGGPGVSSVVQTRAGLSRAAGGLPTVSCHRGIGDLSDAQRAAVLDTRPRVLVSAGAGSGKTASAGGVLRARSGRRGHSRRAVGRRDLHPQSRGRAGLAHSVEPRVVRQIRPGPVAGRGHDRHHPRPLSPAGQGARAGSGRRSGLQRAGG